MAVKVITKAADTDEHYDQVKLVPDVAKDFHVLAKINADPGEEIAPD